MGAPLPDYFGALDDNDGTGFMAQFPEVTVHPNTADSIPPYDGWQRLYPFAEDDHHWYWMNHDGDYGPLLGGEIPATTFLTITGDPWFAARAIMEDDAGSRQYGFQWFASANVTADHNQSYVGHVFGMDVSIANGKTEGQGYYLAFFDSQRDSDSANDGYLPAMFGLYQEFGHGGGGAHSPETDYAVAYKAAIYNGGGDIHHAYAYEAQPVNGGAGTTDLYTVLFGNGGFGDEAMGVRMTNDLKSIWEFQESDIILGNATDLLLGDGVKTGGKNYRVTSDNSYNIDGIVAEGQNRDGAEVLLYNGNSSFNFTVFDNGTHGSAATGNKVFPTTAADLAWNAKKVLHLVYNPSLDTNQGGWIAWVT